MEWWVWLMLGIFAYMIWDNFQEKNPTAKKKVQEKWQGIKDWINR